MFLDVWYHKKIFFLILGNPCSLYRQSSRIGNISAFSASNFVPYTGGGLYFNRIKQIEISLYIKINLFCKNRSVHIHLWYNKGFSRLRRPHLLRPPFLRRPLVLLLEPKKIIIYWAIFRLFNEPKALKIFLFVISRTRISGFSYINFEKVLYAHCEKTLDESK